MSKERFIGWNTIYGAHGEHSTPYMTRIWIGRLRLHIFHRGDADPDCHDHPWDFWTFPLTAYVEEVANPEVTRRVQNSTVVATGWQHAGRVLHRQIVPAFRWSFRAATHTHRVIGRYDPVVTARAMPNAFFPGASPEPLADDGKIVTIVWQGRPRRKWGFLRNRGGQWCWTDWKAYVHGGGKHAPCEPSDGGAP